jgi:hypothetical protein
MVANSKLEFLRDAHLADFSPSEEGRKNGLLTRADRERVLNEPEDEPEGEYATKRTTYLPVKSAVERYDRTALAELKKIIRSLTYGEMMEACGAMTDEPDYKAPPNRDELAAMLHKYACRLS